MPPFKNIIFINSFGLGFVTNCCTLFVFCFLNMLYFCCVFNDSVFRYYTILKRCSHATLTLQILQNKIKLSVENTDSLNSTTELGKR